MKFVCHAADEKRQIQFLWRPFIQRGTLNMITGEPGTGKSTIGCEIAAALSVGRPLPGETEEDAKQRGIIKTLVLNAEDDPNDTMAWRHDIQGADRTKIWRPEHIEAINSDNIKQMAELIRAESIGLIIIDPVQAWIGADIDIYRANHVRAWGNMLKDLCKDTGITVVMVRHRRKGDSADHNTLNSGMGSIDFSGIVRSEIGVVKTKQGNKVTRIKGNVGRLNDTIFYDIREVDDPETIHGQLFWSGDIQQAKPEPARAPKKFSAAQSWLVERLLKGAQPAAELVKAYTNLTGVGKSTIYEAAKEVVVSEHRGKVAYWRLRTPKDDEQPVFDNTDIADALAD